MSCVVKAKCSRCCGFQDSRFKVPVREAPRVAHIAGANQTKQGVSLDYEDIRTFITNDPRADIL